MPDLFSAAGVPASSQPPQPAGPSVAHSATFRRIAGGGTAFVHPCGICGAAVAPFGYGVRLRAAIDSGDAKRAGRWLCALCRDNVGDLP
jgi:hypothetical protein